MSWPSLGDITSNDHSHFLIKSVGIIVIFVGLKVIGKIGQNKPREKIVKLLFPTIHRSFLKSWRVGRGRLNTRLGAYQRSFEIFWSI